MAGWSHKEEPDIPHPVDPHYNGNGLPAFWTCHTCKGIIRLYDAAPPITEPVKAKMPKGEPPMSSQP